MSATSTRVLGLAAAAGTQVAGVGLLLVSAWLIVRAAEQPPVLFLLVAVVSVRFFGVARAGARYAERLLTHDTALAGSTVRRVAVLRGVRRSCLRALDGRRRSEVVRRVVDDVGVVQDGYVRLRVPWVAGLASIAVVATVVLLVHPLAGLAVAGQGLATAALLRVLVARRAGSTWRDASSSREELVSRVDELVHTAPEAIVSGSPDRHRRALQSAVDDLADADRRLAGVDGRGQLLVLGGAATGTVAVVVVVAHAVLAADLAATFAAVALLAPVALIEPLLAIADGERLRPAVEAADRRLGELELGGAAVPDPVVDPGPDGGGDAVPVPADASVLLDGLQVGWPGGPVLTTPTDLVLSPGDVVALTGPSGSGKSTLAATLGRTIPPAAGSVLLGGVDLLDLTDATVQETVGVLDQDAVVFDTTLRENLLVAAPGAGDAQLLAALVRAGLGHLVDPTSAGLDLRVGPQGSRLSGGERQRLALARLLMADHRVLVLDEPTEHLDAETAERLLDDVLGLAVDRSVLLLTHAPAVLARADRVVRLEPASARSRVEAWVPSCC